MPGSSGSPWSRLILVTGHRRSGSTWLASALGKAQGASLIPYEPIWLKWHRESPFVQQVLDWRSRRGWHIAWDPDSGQDQLEARALHQHLEWLCRHYFQDPVDSLVVKEPHPNWLEFLLPAFQPDRLVSLRRHPLGIVNSFDKGNLYTRWNMDLEWSAFRQALPGLFPELASLSEGVRHPAEQVAFLAQVGDRLQDALAAGDGSLIVHYEDLCLEAPAQFEHLYQLLGWAWDEEAWRRLQPIVAPERGERETGFIKVHKRSLERAYAWRRELPWHLIRRLGSSLRRLDPACPLPGNGLPPLERAEILNGYRTYFARRRAYLRNFGLRSFVRSL